jgi:hypothetical protein
MKTGMGTRFSNLKDFALSLATVWFYLGSWMTPLHAMDTTEEVYHYKEVTGDSERVFWAIRMDTLTAHKIRAVKKGVESVEFDGRQKALLWIRLSLPGMLAPFWKSDYWFALPEGVFYRFQGPRGPPGSPKTTVTRTEG